MITTEKIQVVKSLLSEGSTNAKTAKNETKTFILYLAPFNLNSFGLSVCPKASKGCIQACFVDGDSSDIVMMENQGVILGLKAKGKAKKDRTGFVIW
jgi:hypothetical protein